jgi:hypothetical protein
VLEGVGDEGGGHQAQVPAEGGDIVGVGEPQCGIWMRVMMLEGQCRKMCSPVSTCEGQVGQWLEV